MEEVDAIVVGAGVVGLCVARALAQRGLETVLLERGDHIGAQTSSRNSEVIHAGLHYPAGSHKARLCRRGRDLLYDHCRNQGIAHRRCGKLLIATDARQLETLRDIEASALANDVTDLQRLDGPEVLALEPALAAVAGLLSPSTGIVDSHAFMLSLLGDFERAGGVLALRAPVIGIRTGATHIVSVGGVEPIELAAPRVINAAGLWAPQLAALTAGLPQHHVPQASFAKGNYFSLRGPAPFSRLIYPVPEPGGLGVHLTLDLAGQARFGPDVEWLAVNSPDELDYGVDPARRSAFVAAIRRYWPDVSEAALEPAYSGVRPKLSGPGAAPSDFVLQGELAHGVAGLLNLFGIESPGLTASLAIAQDCLSILAV